MFLCAIEQNASGEMKFAAMLSEQNSIFAVISLQRCLNHTSEQISYHNANS